MPPLDGQDVRAGPATNLLLGTHHKTGTILAGMARGKIQRALGDRYLVNSSMHWGRAFCPACPPPGPMDGFPSGYQVVHFVRNPVSAIISGYLYHRDVSGVVMDNDYGESLARKYVPSPELASYIRGNETYSSFLRNVSVRVGLQAELDRFFRQEFEEWTTSFSQCHSHHAICRLVCLEDFGHDYNTTWKRVLAFAGHNLSAYPGLMDDLSMHDVHLHPSVHMTEGSVTRKRRRRMVAHVDEIDRSVYEGRLAALPSALHTCGATQEERRRMVKVKDGLDAWA